MTNQLPSRPSLEHLKNEAKALLKSQQAGNKDCCRVLRLLNRFASKSDEEILAAQLQLADAQYAVALEYGFKSWTSLKRYVENTAPAQEIDTTTRRQFGEKEAWAAIDASARDIQSLPESVQSDIVGIIVAGSLVRGDFVENRSGVHIFTALADTAGPAWESETHWQARECFDKHFRPYLGSSAHPYVWDDVTVGMSSLPRLPEDAGRHRIRALGVYFFDTVKHHKTVFGEDFTLRMAPPADPKPLLPERMNWLLNAADEIVLANRENQKRMQLLAGGAVVALQIYYGDEPTVNKFEVLPNYERTVPEFEMKRFGRDVWNEYLSGEPTYSEDLPRPFEDYYRFLRQVRDTVNQRARQ